MHGTVERIRAYPKKGKTGRDLKEGRFIENLGLEGDFHAEGGERQISLLLADPKSGTEDSRQTTDPEERGLCFSRFSENITIRGPAPAELKQGTRLSTAEVILEISGETKRCHEDCKLYEAGKRCSLAGLNLFAKVSQSGYMRVGERIDFVT